MPKHDDPPVRAVRYHGVRDVFRTIDYVRTTLIGHLAVTHGLVAPEVCPVKESPANGA